MRLRALGFWRSVRIPDDPRPDPRDFLDPDWDVEERRLVAAYLRAGRRLTNDGRSGRCRLCGAAHGRDELSDGTYVWPEGLAHDVLEHSVRLPAAFVEHVRAEHARVSARENDESWWLAEPPTGTARQWIRYRIELGPCDVRATSIIQQIAGGVIGWDRAERIYTELVRHGTANFALPDRGPAEELAERLELAGVHCRVVAEPVPAPDALLG